jgi:hypothetical protein
VKNDYRSEYEARTLNGVEVPLKNFVPLLINKALNPEDTWDSGHRAPTFLTSALNGRE